MNALNQKGNRNEEKKQEKKNTRKQEMRGYRWLEITL